MTAHARSTRWVYTSLAASADGRRLVVTRPTANGTLWRLRIPDSSAEVSEPNRIPLTTITESFPRLGGDYLPYVSAAGTAESIWKLAKGTSTELWRGEGARILGAPAISPDGRYIAFPVRRNGRTLLYAMQADGMNARVVTDSLDLQGALAWALMANRSRWRPTSRTPLQCSDQRWLSPDDNPAPTNGSPRSEFLAARVFKGEARVSIRPTVRPRAWISTERVRSRNTIWRASLPGHPPGRKVAYALLSRGSWLQFDTDVVVQGSADSLLAPQIPFGCLDGNMA